MKRLLLLLFTIFSISFQVSAASSEADLVEQSIRAYSNGNYDSTRVILQGLVDQGYHSFELYYNLGNSYFKLNQIDESILYYEKARKLKPKDEDLLFNLELANARISDQIPRLPGSKFVENVIGFCTTNCWAGLSFITFSIFLISLLSFLLVSKGVLKSISLFAFIILFSTSTLFFVFASISKSTFDNKLEYIVFQSVINVSSAPNPSGKQLFVIHRGLKVEYLQESGEYAKIKLPDGNIGWVEKQSIRKI
jgi:tetratricopeptide (TPR) repeat protein